ncbi:MAG: type II secretion system protein [Clostridium sp.]|nr:type II secretion system protein [Clostridium sp.]
MIVRKKGVTLIELMIVIAVMSIVFSAIYLTLSNGYNMYADDQRRDDVEENINSALNDISVHMKASKSYIPTDNFSADSRYNTDNIQTGIKVLYCENDYNNRFVYLLEGHELHRLYFKTDDMQKYELESTVTNGDYSYVEEQVPELDGTQAAYNKYKAEIDPQNFIEGTSDTDYKSIIDTGSDDNFYNKYTPIARIYEESGDKCFLLAQNKQDNHYYKMNMLKESNLDFKNVTSDTVVAYNISSISISADKSVYYDDNGQVQNNIPADPNYNNFKYGNSVTVNITATNGNRSKNVITKLNVINSGDDEQ